MALHSGRCSAFVIGVGLVIGAYVGVTKLPGMLAQRKLRCAAAGAVAPPDEPEGDDGGRPGQGPAQRGRCRRSTAWSAAPSAAPRSARWIEQSGVKISVSGVLLIVAGCRRACSALIVGDAPRVAVGLADWRRVGFALPFMFLKVKRTRRLRTFEEQFPEALDLISRALKAGHAFATGLKMVADEMAEPVGPEFRKTFDEQNFGLPLKDALDNLTRAHPAARRPLLRDRGPDPARDRRQPLGDSREPRARRARALQDSAAGARLHGARPADRLRAAGAAGVSGHRAVVHQPRAHEPAVPGAHGPDAAHGAPSVMQIVGYIWIKQVVKIEV